MPSWPATRRASSAASSEQQLRLNSLYVSATSWRRIQTPTVSTPGRGQERRRDRRVDAARHRDEDALAHARLDRSTPARDRLRPPPPVARARSAPGRPRRGAAGDRRRDERDGPLDLLVGGRSSQRQAQRAACLVVGKAHRGEHVAGLARAGRAGRAGGAAQAVQVERRDHERVAVDVACHHRAGGPAAAPRGWPVSSTPGVARTASRSRSRWRRSRRHGGRSLRAGQVVGDAPCRPHRPRPPCPRAGSVPGCRRGSAAGWPCRGACQSAPDPLGPSNLWPASDSRSTSSACTSMSRYGAAWTASRWISTPRTGSDAAHELGDRLERAHLVVGQLDRDQDGLLVERRRQLVGIHPAVAVHRQHHHLEAELLEVAQRVERPRGAQRHWSRCGCPCPCPPRPPP